MGDLQACTPRENLLFMSVPSSSPPSPTLPLSNPSPSTITAECWAAAEQITQQILYGLQPTLMADHKRKEVIDYVRRLIRRYLGCEVFPYGSVPLVTYLPDGDIDLTVLSSPNVDDALASGVRAVLEAEEYNESAEFEVKDVQFIDAEVKLVKCLVQDIVVDISFNQLGGLCTLCFLEQVDHLIGNDHIFKRSIILIKAWCFYESRVLGAHHGLISTYALATLVLYIFHLFHSSLNGPLAVLYRFLDYFSKFDWDNYCISLNGPVCKASLPEIVAELPENGGDGLLLSEEFLRNCVDMYSVPSRGLDTELRAFPKKHLNIIDPLKENNNLGRSVNRANFYRIRGAFKYGARKLGWILMLSKERIADELKIFFTNTLERPGNIYASFLEGFSDGKVPAEDKKALKIKNETDSYPMKVASLQTVSETTCPANGIPVSGYCLSMDSNELVTSSFLDDKTENGNLHHTMSASSNNDSAEELSSLCDLSGDYDSNIRNLLCGQSCHMYALSAPLLPSPPVPPPLLRNPGDSVCHSLQPRQNFHSRMNANGGSSQLRNKNSWDHISHSLQAKQSFHSQINSNGAISRSQHHLANHPTLPGATFSSDEKQKQRGTGTYFPNTNYQAHWDSPLLGRGRKAAGTRGQLHKHTPKNSLVKGLPEIHSLEEVNNDPAPEHHSVLEQVKSESSEFHQSHPSSQGSSNTNGFVPSERLEFGSVVHDPWVVPSEEARSYPDLGNPHTKSAATSPGSPSLQESKPILGNKPERVEGRSYHLKDEDFPPLSQMKDNSYTEEQRDRVDMNGSPGT